VPYANESDTKHDFEPYYTFNGYDVEWHECPFKTRQEAEAFAEAMNKFYLADSGDERIQFVEVPCMWAKGKKRELGHARSCAVWPDATDEQLLSPDFSEKLEARLPALIESFKADMLACGFIWEATDEGVK
jgi:hypothetical protein